MIARWRLLWRALTARRDFERELDDELDFHREARAQHLIRQGVPAREAQRRARLELGMTGLHRDDCRRARGLPLFDTVLRDLRYALRGLVRNPGYSLTALAVLGIALCANALLFTLFSAYGLRAPPIAEPERWVTLEAFTLRNERLATWRASEADALISQPPAGLDRLYSLREVRLTVSAEVTRPASGEAVSDNYFEVLGVHAARGRTFSADSGSRGEVVLSHLGWQRLLGGREDVLGATISVSGQPFSVIGIMPPEFTGTTPLLALYWLGEGDYRRLQPREDAQTPALEVSGLRSADAALAPASEALLARALTWNGERHEEHHIDRAEVAARRGYLPAADVRDLILACLPVGIAFALVLLVAAANLANLVLARFASRQRELAVRVSVGAPRVRLVAQLLTECVLLASLSALLALGLAALLLAPAQALLFALMGDFGIDLIDLRLEPYVAVYTWTLALIATLAFGALPAWLATAPWARGRARPDLSAMHRASGTRLRAGLMVGQIAISVVLLVLAGLVAVNARRVDRTDPGFEVERTLAVHVWRTSDALLRELGGLPEVEQVAVASRAPLMGTPHRADARIDARSEALFVRAVDAPYLDLFGIAVLRGRGLHRGDEAGARVALVSRSTAQRLWPDQDPLGRHIDLPPQDALGSLPHGRFEVVGVVEDVVSAWFISGLDASAVYLPLHAGHAALGSVLLRTRDTTAATLDAVARACVRAAPDQNCELMPMLQAVKVQRLPFLIASTVASALGWIALAISCLGLYGLVAYLVVQKRREIGVRLALGAPAARITREMLRTASLQIGLGIAIGLPVAFGLTRVLAAFTDRISTFDPGSFVLVPTGLAVLALLAAWLPARRSARVPPTEALRQE